MVRKRALSFGERGQVVIALSAYSGGLVASLTYPARYKALNTFLDVLELPEEATIKTFGWTAVTEILQQSTNPTLQVQFS